MEINLVLLIVLLLIMFASGAGAGFFCARHQKSEALRVSENTAHSLREQLLVLEGQADQLRINNRELTSQQEREKGILNALAPIQKQLDLVNRQVIELDQHTAGASEKLLTQLANDAKLFGELRASTEALNSALRSSSARGNWGEVQLRRILEAAGMMPHVDFNLQQKGSSFTNSESLTDTRTVRPDAIIHLPNDGHLAIDAKVPLDAYLKAQAIDGTGEEAQLQRNKYLADHAKAMNAHVKELIKRNYPADFPNSPQITILFVPSEALLSISLEQDITLLETALRNGIVLTSPSSLFALLRAVASIWSSAAATNEVAKIVELGRTLTDRLNVTVKHLTALGKSLSSAVKNYNSAIGSFESRVLSTARSFESIETGGLAIEKGIPEISNDAGQVREFTSRDFTDTFNADETE